MYIDHGISKTILNNTSNHCSKLFIVTLFKLVISWKYLGTRVLCRLPSAQFKPRKPGTQPFMHVPFTKWHCPSSTQFPHDSVQSLPKVPLSHSVTMHNKLNINMNREVPFSYKALHFLFCLYMHSDVFDKQPSVQRFPLYPGSHPFIQVPSMWWHGLSPTHFPQICVQSWPNVPFSHTVDSWNIHDVSLYSTQMISFLTYF